MRIRKEVFVLVGIIAVLSVYLYRRSDEPTGYKLPALPPVAAADITRIEVIRDGETLELRRQDDRWRIGSKGYALDRKLAGEMLEAISDLKLTAVVAESKSYALYELDEGRRVHVKAWSQDRLQRDFHIGKVAPSFRHTFVRLDGDERVYHALNAFRDRFVRSLDDMRDKTVLAFKPEEIQEVQLTRPNRSLTLRRAPAKTEGAEAAAQPVWQGGEGQAVEAAAVEDLFKRLSALNCDKFLPDRSASDFSNPVLSIALKGAGQLTFSLFAPAEKAEDKSSPGVSSGSDEPFLLSEFQVTPLIQKADEVLASGAPVSK